MVYFTLQLTSNESTFEYSFPQEFLDKKYEIGLVKLDGNLEMNNKININYTNNKFYYIVSGVDQNNSKVLTKGKHVSENKFNSKTIDYVFVWCNLIDDSYVNNRKLNSIYKFKFDNDEINNQDLLISVEARQIIYHKVISRQNKIILKLVDINNNLITLIHLLNYI
jgi:hypothetical protein